MRGGQRLEVVAFGSAAGGRAIDLGDLVQERPVLHLRQPLPLGAGTAVGVVAGLRLGDVDGAAAVNRQAVEQGSDSADGAHSPVGAGIEDEKIAVGELRVLDDVGIVVGGQHVVVAEYVLHGVERAAVAVDALRLAAGQLGLVVGLERDHVEPVVAHRNGAGILRGDRQPAGDGAGRDVHHRNPVRCRQGDVGLRIARERDADGFVHAGGERGRMEVVDGGDDLLEEVTVRVGVDHAHRVGDVVGDPDFLPVRADGEAHGVDADVDAVHHRVRAGVDHVHGVRRRIGRVDEVAVDDDGICVRTVERGPADVVGDVDDHAGVGTQNRDGWKCERKEHAAAAATPPLEAPSHVSLADLRGRNPTVSTRSVI